MHLHRSEDCTNVPAAAAALVRKDWISDGPFGHCSAMMSLAPIMTGRRAGEEGGFAASEK